MANERPNADELLARVQADENRAQRGKLKIFFGYAAGVGKTFAMLEAARRERVGGVDVVVGYVEPHGRAETEALLDKLDALPPRLVPYRNVMLREFDLDAALARRPALILVDELAHTNAEGSRHLKRWQDVEELLEAGIDVYTTLNVQHVESMNDVIAQITGVVVQETLPDAVLEGADNIELIDITPEDLIQRLMAGKVYLPAQAERALRNFFQKSNLVALREISLRQAAHQLRREVDAARQEKDAQTPWATSERLLVCVGPSPTSLKLIRTAKRMAAAFGADWLAVAVETRGDNAPAAVRQSIANHLRLAEQLGAETHTLIGANVAPTILDYARSRNVTKIVVGKTAVSWWRRLGVGTVVDQLLDQSGDIDVYVIRGDSDAPATAPPIAPSATPIVWWKYAATAGIVVLCGFAGALSYLVHPTPAQANVAMIFLLGVAFAATWFGRGPAIFCSIASVLVFDFLFVEPYYTFNVSDAQYFFTFAVMLSIGLMISTLTARIREQLRASQRQERRTDALYRLTKQLSEINGVEFLIRTAGQQLREIFAGEVVLFARDAKGPLALRFGADSSIAAQPVNAIVAQWVADHDRIAGLGTDTLPNATAYFVPLTGSQQSVGSLGIRPDDLQRFLDPEQRRLLESCASLIALSIERDQSILQASEAELQIQTEQLRNSLLSSVSHDLRTPLAAIAGAGTSLLEKLDAPDAATQHELLHSIVDEARRMARLVDNLLDMTRLASGAIALKKEWQVLEEIVGSALTRLRRELAQHRIDVRIPSDLPLLFLDGILMEQVFFNLLENAARYAPAGSRIEITAAMSGKRVTITCSDDGPGLAPGTEARIFEKFYRGASANPDGRRGVGLGLAICKAILEAHDGQITARNRASGGAEFTMTLPCEQTAPHVPLDNIAAVSGGRAMTMPLLLIVEDELPIRRFLRSSLAAEHRLVEAETGKDALRLAAQQPPDLVILDLGLPDMDGQEVLQQLREWLQGPIIVLSARDQEKQKILALDNGADDYLTKPFSTGELQARIRVALRHAARAAVESESAAFAAGDLKVDFAVRRVFVGDTEIHLTPLEYKLLATLIQHAGKVLTHRFLLKEVWGPHHVQETHYLRVFMASLRRKIEADPAQPRYLLTEQGVGYRLAGDAA